MLAIRILIANGAHSSCGQWRNEQIWRLLPMAQGTFYNQNVAFLCKQRRNECSGDIGNCAVF
jgi:hypothetical protein